MAFSLDAYRKSEPVKSTSRPQMLFLMIVAVAFVPEVWWALTTRNSVAIYLIVFTATIMIFLMLSCREDLATGARRINHYSSRKSLIAAAEAFERELELRNERDGIEHGPEIRAGIGLLSLAKKHAGQGDIAAAWSCFTEAQLVYIFLLEGNEVKIKDYAIETLFKSKGRLSSWRLDAVKELLQKSDAPCKVRDDIKVYDLRIARRILEDHIQNNHERLVKAGWQFYIMIGVALPSLLFLALTIPKLSEPLSLEGDWLLTAVVIVLGALGGATSGFWRILSLFADRDSVPEEQVLNSWLVSVRPLLGAVLSLVVALLLLSNLLSLGTLTLNSLLSVCFIAGFSEELVLGVIKRIAGGTSDKDK